MSQTPEQENVDRWYRALTNAEYDRAHGYAGSPEVERVRDRYREALNARDAAERQ